MVNKECIRLQIGALAVSHHIHRKSTHTILVHTTSTIMQEQAIEAHHERTSIKIMDTETWMYAQQVVHASGCSCTDCVEQQCVRRSM